MMSTPVHTTSAIGTESYVPASYTYFDLDPTMHQNFQYIEKTTYSTTPMGKTVTTTQEAAPKKVGLMARISHGVKGLVDRTSESLGLSSDTNSRWALFGLQDNLLAEFPCKLVNVDKFVRGYMYISSHNLCYASHADTNNRVIKFVMPLTSITNVRQAQKLKTTKGALPSFTPIVGSQAATAVRPDSIQVIDNNNMIHQFYGFRTQFMNCFNVLQHAWCTARGMQPGMMNTGGMMSSAPTTMMGNTSSTVPMTSSSTMPLSSTGLANPIPGATTTMPGSFSSTTTQFIPATTTTAMPMGATTAMPMGTTTGMPMSSTTTTGLVDPLVQKQFEQHGGVFPTTTTSTTQQGQYPLQK